MLRDGAQLLAEADIDNPRLEARLLLAHATGRTSEDLIRDLTAPGGPSDFAALIARRAAHEPLAFILGWKEFWSLRFQVTPATLIPRPESETLVEAALDLFPDPAASPRILDLGTGTGCLLVACLHERPAAFGIGTDLAWPALRVARHNASNLGLAGRAAFLCGDWATAVSGRFDLVLSNPPYIPTADLDGLMPEVGSHEPRGALDGGPCGLTAYRAIISSLRQLVSPSGAAIFELGAGQAEAVKVIAEAAAMRVSVRSDLAGIARAMILRPSP